jgi:hypothetical protein
MVLLLVCHAADVISCSGVPTQTRHVVLGDNLGAAAGCDRAYARAYRSLTRGLAVAELLLWDLTLCQGSLVVFVGAQTLGCLILPIIYHQLRQSCLHPHTRTSLAL